MEFDEVLSPSREKPLAGNKRRHKMLDNYVATHALSQMHVSKACRRKKLPLEAGTEGYEDLFLHILLYLYSIQSGGGRNEDVVRALYAAQNR